MYQVRALQRRVLYADLLTEAVRIVYRNSQVRLSLLEMSPIELIADSELFSYSVLERRNGWCSKVLTLQTLWNVGND